MKGCTYNTNMNTGRKNFMFQIALLVAMLFAGSQAAATVIIASGPAVRIPGISTATVLQLTGADANRPQRWTRQGSGPSSSVVTIAGTYFAEVNLSTNENFPFWVQAGSITIPALSHSLALSGPATLSPGVQTSLCLQSNGSAYVVSRNWIFNARDQFSNNGDPACQTIYQPGAYYLQVTYQFGSQSVIISTAAINIIAAASAPAVTLNKSTVDPVSSLPVCTIANFSAFVNVSRYKNGSFNGTVTSASSSITSPGLYFLMGTLPGGAGVFSYEFSITKGSIPAPAVFADATELTYTDPEMQLHVSPGNYNAGYTWYYNNAVILNETAQHTLVTRPGPYKVRACAIHSDGQTECKTSDVLTITGEVMKVNSVTRRTSRVQGIVTEQQINNSPKEQVNQAATYLDGFARPLQSVGRENSPAGKDVIVINAYDAQGREQKKFLPFVSVQTDGKYRHVSPSDPAALNLFYQASGDQIANTLAPHAVTVFEPSPLNRVKEQGAEGEDWQPGTGHTERYNYTVYKQTNTVNDVLLWKENTQGQLVATGKYFTESLQVTEITNENGSLQREFTDRSGRKVLSEMPGDGAQRLRTYYVYDDLGKLKYVLPPRITSTVSTTPFTLPTALIKNECFRYQYDERGRMIVKQAPGTEPHCYVYDLWDRPVLSQTGNQRGGQRWSFTKYDALDRPVMTGEVAIAGSQAEVQQQVNNFYVFVPGNPLLRYEQTGSAILGYTNRSYPVLTGETQVNTVTYYDHYTFIPAPATAYAFVPQPELSLTGAFLRTKGLVTGTRNRILGSTQFLLTVNYYDTRYRPIQVITDHHLGGTDIVSNQYDFEGKPLRKKRIHQGNVPVPVTVLEEYGYDFAGRLTEVYHSINGQSPVLLLQNQYNALGQLTEKNFHGANGSFWQSRDYEYNIRGWLTRVNGGAETGSLFNDMYSFELAYNQPLAGITSTAQYNGNVAAYAEVRPFEQENAQAVKSGYAYGYDAADRLKTASYARISDPALNGAYNESLSYDLNGNINSLARKGVVEASQQVIDQLTYSYTGNQLQKVDDTANPQAGFRDTGNAIDYSYDANGNLTSDGNKAITSIQYDLLDLPASVTFSDGRSLTITYSAAGEKLRQVVYNANQSVKEKYDYVGGILYRNDSLKVMQHEEGRVVYIASGGQWVYEYNLKDHLGNIRCTFTTGVEEEVFTATLEEGDAANEANVFGKSYEDVMTSTAGLFNHTAKGTRSLRLSGATEKEITGLAKSIHVLPGDKITMEVYAKYVAGRGRETYVNKFMMDVLSSAFGLSAGAPGEAGLAYESLAALDQAGLLIHSGKEVDDQAPRAYLNYILFDKDFIPYDLGFDQIDPSAREDGSGVPHDHLQLEVSITRPGYIYIYLSNESAVVTDVFFDDLAITYMPSPIIETATYYPFGMLATQNTREGMTEQRTKYNGKELLNEEGLDWYDYGARMYDAALGRWHVIDPLAGKYPALSPYHYALNNPVKFVDPDGKDSELVIDDENKTATIQANYYVSAKDMDKALDAVAVWTGMSGKQKIQVGKEKYTLNFAMQVIQVNQSGDPADLAHGDPIGNVITIAPGFITNEAGYVLAGSTHASKVMTMPGDASALEIAHEMGHTFLGLEGGGQEEHISNTIMDKADTDQERRINKDFVKKVRQTYGLEKNPSPTKPFNATTIKPTGEEVISYYGGENFRTRHQPRVSNEQLRKYFQSIPNNPKQ